MHACVTPWIGVLKVNSRSPRTVNIRTYQRRSQESTKPGLASSSSSSSFLQPLLAFFFLLMAVTRAKPGLHVNHGRRGGWSTGSPPAGFVAGLLRDIDTYTTGFARGTNQGQANIFRAVKCAMPRPVRISSYSPCTAVCT